jgi:hypothetical protein
MQETRDHDDFDQLPNHPTFRNKERKCRAEQVEKIVLREKQ